MKIIYTIPFQSIACKSIRFFLFSSIIALLLIQSCQTQNKADSELLKKTIDYHDPDNNWGKLKTHLYLKSVDTAGQVHPFEIEIDNTTGYFAHISHQEGKELVKGISAKGEEFYLLDGNPEITEGDRKKYELTPEALKWVHSFYPYLYGLPMKLTDAGVKVIEAEDTEELKGKNYQVLKINFDQSVGSDNWFFYLDPQTYEMEAYKFNHGDPESGEYILLEQELTVDGIKIPKVRKWYWNKNNEYIGTDTLIKAEPLSAHRI